MEAPCTCLGTCRENQPAKKETSEEATKPASQKASNRQENKQTKNTTKRRVRVWFSVGPTVLKAQGVPDLVLRDPQMRRRGAGSKKGPTVVAKIRKWQNKEASPT